MNAIARFAVRTGDESHLLLPGKFVIGRQSDCDLIVSDRMVSRRHAVLELDASTATLSDSKSRNGTRVNGVPIDHMVLPHGAVVQLGAATCIFEWLGNAGASDDQPTPALAGLVQEQEPILTVAERRVMACLLSGLAEKAIAAKLVISRHTVHNHIKRIYAAHRVNTRAELLARFVHRGVRD